MDHHLGREEQSGDNRNGYGRKTVISDSGQMEIAVPRDRKSSFDPQLIAKYQRRFPDFDDKIISMYRAERRRRVLEWTMAKAHFAVLFGERFMKAMAA